MKNALNNESGFIKEVDVKSIKCGIKYYDRMYRKTVYLKYQDKKTRDGDFNDIKDSNYNYIKIG